MCANYLGPVLDHLVCMCFLDVVCHSLEMYLHTLNKFLLNLSLKWSIFLVVISSAQIIMHIISMLMQ